MDARVLALIALAVLCFSAWSASRLYRAQVRRTQNATEPRDEPLDDRPTILGFTGDYCLPCRTQQHPALERLRAQLGDAVRVEEVDAIARADLARRYGVLTVPTTVVLDGARQVVAINYGVASAEKLLGQVGPLVRA